MVDSSGKKVKRKQAMLKTRKSISSSKRAGGGGDSDDHDDFMSTKKASAAKAPGRSPPRAAHRAQGPKPKHQTTK